MTDNKQNARKQAQRRARQRKQRNRRIALTACLMIAVMVASIGGTLAWLTATTTPVVNTFTPADINITLAETTSNNYPLVPGKPYAKDPKVTVLANSEKCWLFVKVNDNSASDYVDYTFRVDNGTSTDASDDWRQGDGNDIPSNVYYRVVDANTADQSWYLLQGSEANPEGNVTIRNTIVKSSTNAPTNVPVMPSNAPTLSFEAYAVQYYGFETNAAGAWAQAQQLKTTP